MSEHTKEPWRFEAFTAEKETDDEWWAHIWGAEGASAVATVNWTYTDQGDPRANARRIVAAVNACAGIETETLENLEGASFAFFAHEQEARADEAERLLRLVDGADIRWELGDELHDEIRAFLEGDKP